MMTLTLTRNDIEKVELKLKWTKYCVLSAAGTKNDIKDSNNANNINLAIKAQNYMLLL